MKPFNIEAALAGEPVFNGHGVRVVIEPSRVWVDSKYTLGLTSKALGGQVLAYHTPDGKSFFSLAPSDSRYDLFMGLKTRTVYINLWDSPSFHYSKYNTRQEALDARARHILGLSPYHKLNSEPIELTIED